MKFKHFCTAEEMIDKTKGQPIGRGKSLATIFLKDEYRKNTQKLNIRLANYEINKYANKFNRYFSKGVQMDTKYMKEMIHIFSQ